MEETNSVKLENASTVEEVLDTRTPEEIEKDLLEQEHRAAIEAVSKRPVEEIAAQFFAIVYPMFRAKLQGLMAKDAKQVIDALIAFPIEMQNPTFRNEVSEQVFSLGTRLLDAKFIMQQAVEMDKTIQAEKKQSSNTEAVQDVLNAVETNFEQGENANG